MYTINDKNVICDLSSVIFVIYNDLETDDR